MVDLHLVDDSRVLVVRRISGVVLADAQVRLDSTTGKQQGSAVDGGAESRARMVVAGVAGVCERASVATPNLRRGRLGEGQAGALADH
jgi:hypothetical protein